MRNKSGIITLVLFSVLDAGIIFAQDTPSFKVERLSFNTGQFSEISPVITREGIVFCSDRRTSGITDRTSFDNSRLYNIYLAARKDSTGWARPSLVKSDRSTLFNNGPFCISPDGKTVYFTSEIETGVPSKNRKFRNRSGIFSGTLSGSEIISLQPFKFNNPDYNLGQPSVSPDGKFLFFASDMPGGQGGSDIYSCEWINGEWSSPVNLGVNINSSGTDNYPFVHASGKLYFTSDRPGGLGGLDVYSSTMVDGNWGMPERLPEPVNSPADDFAFVAQDDFQRGYFASNRLRNDDIFEFVPGLIRKSSCNTLEKNTYCYEFAEENAIKYDSIPFRYEWRFGDGNSGEGKITEHCYPGPGTYTVQLDVVNLVTQEVTRNIKSDILVVEDIEQPFISSPDEAQTGRIISFSADSTNLPGWDIARYYWNFGDETIAIGKNVEKRYMKEGDYNIQLIVSTKPETGGRIREACVSKNILIK